MFARLERELNLSNDLADKARAAVVRAMLQDRGEDIPFPDNFTPEKMTEVKRFSPETKKALETRGFVVYELNGASLNDLRQQGNKFWSDWHQGMGFDSENSEGLEVAINPDCLFLEGSNGKTLDEQKKLVSKYSESLGEEVNGVKAVIGEANQYAELAFAHFKKTGIKIFGEKYGYNYARTVTVTGASGLVGVGRFGDLGLGVNYWYRAHRDDRLWVSPLVVPGEA